MSVQFLAASHVMHRQIPDYTMSLCKSTLVSVKKDVSPGTTPLAFNAKPFTTSMLQTQPNVCISKAVYNLTQIVTVLFVKMGIF